MGVDRQPSLNGPDNSVRLVRDLLLAHGTTKLRLSLYLAAARALHAGFCEGAYIEGRIKCRICGANL